MTDGGEIEGRRDGRGVDGIDQPDRGNEDRKAHAGDSASAPGFDEEGAETSGLAIASLALGIVWLFGLGSIVAIGLGSVALRRIRESGGHQGGRVIAIAGIVVGIAGLASTGLVVAFVLSSAH